MRGRVVFVVCVFFGTLMVSCGSLPFEYPVGRAWYMDKNTHHKEIKGSFELLGVTAEKTGGWDSLEKEIEGLAPLYFWEQGCYLKTDNAEADYAADIRIREREYISRWRTKRSISVEVRIWDLKEPILRPDTAGITRTLPLAVGRVTADGDASFSSSETVGRMLALAIKKAVKRLENEKRSD